MTASGRWKAALDRFVAELRALYGPRLERVVLYGSRARGEADEDSDIDVLVVLDDVKAFWEDFSRIGALADRISLEHDVVLSAIPVASGEYRTGQTPLLLNSRREGVAVG